MGLITLKDPIASEGYDGELTLTVSYNTIRKQSLRGYFKVRCSNNHFYYR